MILRYTGCDSMYTNDTWYYKDFKHYTIRRQNSYPLLDIWSK